MSAMSDYLENVVLNHFLRNEPTNAPQSVYVALYTSDPTDADIGNEVEGGGYARQQVEFSPPINGSTANNVEVVFPVAQDTWGEVSFIGVCDNAVGGNLLFHGPVLVTKTITKDDQLIIPAGNLKISIDGCDNNE